MALVLSAGGARGAYEVGVARYLRDRLDRRLGRRVPLDILAGASIGSVNACFLAALAATPSLQAKRLAEVWEQLDLAETLRIDLASLWSFVRGRSGRALLDASALGGLVRRRVPWGGIRESFRRGAVECLAVLATQLRSGRTFTFVERRGPAPAPTDPDAPAPLCDTQIGPDHALASAAIPLFLPPVLIDGTPFCDGGLRQLTPLGPALRLGANVVLVVSLGCPPPVAVDGSSPESASASASGLAARLFSLFLADHVERDLARLRRVNGVLSDVVAAAGPAAQAVLGEAIVRLRGQMYRPVTDVLIRPSRDPGALASEYVKSARFRRRAHGLVGRILLDLAERSADSARLLSYVLFDGGFASELIALGAEDASAHEERLGRIFEGILGRRGLHSE